MANTMTNVRAVVVQAKSGGSFVARSRDLGLIFIQKSLVDCWKENPILTGQWLLLNMRETGEASNPQLGTYVWRATLVMKRNANLLPDVQRGKNGLQLLSIDQVPAVVTTVYQHFGFLYSEHLGRINMDKGTEGFLSSQFPAFSFATVSVRPVLEGSHDYYWTATKIQPFGNQTMDSFPTIQSCEAKLVPEALFVGHGKLMTREFGMVFFSYNDYFEDIRNRRPLTSFMLQIKRYKIYVVPTQHGFKVTHRAVHVRPWNTPLLPQPQPTAPNTNVRASVVRPTIRSPASLMKDKEPQSSGTVVHKVSSPEKDFVLPSAMDSQSGNKTLITDCINKVHDGGSTPSTSSTIDDQWEKEIEEELLALPPPGPPPPLSPPLAPPLAPPAPSSTADSQSQTEPNQEREVIKDLMNDKDIIGVICSKRPDLMGKLLTLVTQRF